MKKQAEQTKTYLLLSIQKAFKMLEKCETFNDFMKVQPYILNIFRRSTHLIALYNLNKDFHLTFNISCLIQATEAKHKICLDYTIRKILQ
jgi:hypothetical protein